VSGETILVVEDADAIRKMICLALGQSGYECLEAADGVEALRMLESRPKIHLVLTDMLMPKMGGRELAAELARSRPDLRILFMSGFSNDPVVRTVAGSAIFLAKPFTADVLNQRVRQALDRPWHGPPEMKLASGQQ
jgi:two-component system cell cycle sensor histidine kinase/response regulator CckA